MVASYFRVFSTMLESKEFLRYLFFEKKYFGVCLRGGYEQITGEDCKRWRGSCVDRAAFPNLDTRWCC